MFDVLNVISKFGYFPIIPFSATTRGSVAMQGSVLL